jgi:hypothetical protein
MQILDTQIISYALKDAGNWHVTGQHIASITAKEFLLVQDAKSKKVNYYVPLPRRFQRLFESDVDTPKMEHPFSRNSTDQIILEFGSDYPAISEYGNLAITTIINQRQKRLLNETVRFLSKPKRKTILHRFNFLIQQKINCIPLNSRAIDIGFDLFFEFMLAHNPKQNWRNTVYDILSFATAIESSAVLITRDMELSRFASEQYNGRVAESNGNMTIDFGSSSDIERRNRRESKGYINRSWQASIKNHQGAW